MIVWNACMAYGCEITSQLCFWLVTTVTDFFYQSKPAPVFPFCPETVTQTWLFAQGLTRMHINTISCSTGSNKRACTDTHTESIYAASSKCSVWHQIRSHSIGSLQSASNGQKQMDFADAPSTEGGADSHTAHVSQPVHPSCVLYFISGSHVFPFLCITDICAYVYCPCPRCLGMCCLCTVMMMMMIIMHSAFPIVAQPMKYL